MVRVTEGGVERVDDHLVRNVLSSYPKARFEEDATHKRHKNIAHMHVICGPSSKIFALLLHASKVVWQSPYIVLLS